MQANSIFVVVYSETEHKFHGRGKLHCRLCIFGVFSNFHTFFNSQVFECKPFANEIWKKIEERHTCSKRQKSQRGSHRWGWWAQGPPEPSEACWMESSTGNVSFEKLTEDLGSPQNRKYLITIRPFPSCIFFWETTLS